MICPELDTASTIAIEGSFMAAPRGADQSG